MRINFIETEAAHQVLDLCVRLIEPGVAERHRARLRAISSPSRALIVFRAAFGDQIGNRILEAAQIRLRHAESLGANDLDLAHRNAAGDLSRVFGECRDQQQLLEFAEPALAVEAARPFVHLAQTLDGRREPGEPVGRMLSIVDTARFLNS